MRTSRLLSSFVALTLLGGVAPSVTLAQPVVRDHRTQAGPTSAPPPPKTERAGAPRRGQVWVAGSWDWRGNKWVWTAGRYQPRKKGKRFNEARWENRGGRWERIGGDWVDAPKEPDQPPAPLAETPQQRPGFVWVKGYWQWNDGSYDWVPGKLERRPRGKQWRDGEWANAGGRWTWNAGTWVDAPREPTTAPPAPREERRQSRRGFVWVAGRWDWQDGEWTWVPGKLERRQRGKRWKQGEWANTGGRWTWHAGMWADAPATQDAPPAPVTETVQPRRGYVFARGHWEWRDGDYEWVPGHWEREKAGKRWVEASWTNTSGTWTFSAGRWE